MKSRINVTLFVTDQPCNFLIAATGLYFVGFLVVSSLLLPPCTPAAAQQPKKVPRIGYLIDARPSLPTESARADAIRLASARAWLHRRTKYHHRDRYAYAEGKPERFPALASELVRLKVEIIVVSGRGRDASARSKMRPRRFPSSWWALGIRSSRQAGLIDSLAHPGGNVTGVTNLNPDI